MVRLFLVLLLVALVAACHPIHSFEVQKTGDGDGRVVDSFGLSQGFTDEMVDCGQVCKVSSGTGKATLIAQPDPSSVFVGWTGCDSVTEKGCFVHINRDRVVQAEFRLVAK